jgi:hypothetical protein
LKIDLSVYSSILDFQCLLTFYLFLLVMFRKLIYFVKFSCALSSDDKFSVQIKQFNCRVFLVLFLFFWNKDLTMYPKLLWSCDLPCFSLSCAGITRMNHYAHPLVTFFVVLRFELGASHLLLSVGKCSFT